MDQISLILKELHVCWRDRKSRVVLIAPTIMETIIFSFAATMEVNNVSLAILNQDRGRESYELVQRCSASSTFSHLVYLDGVQEIVPTLDREESLLVVHIPVDFSRRLQRGEASQIQVLLDGRRTNAAQIVLGYVTQIAEGYARELAETMEPRRPRPVVVARSWFNPNKNYRWFTVLCLVGTITTLEALILTGLSVARERELGTFEQLLVSPLQPAEIMVGKTVPPMLIGVQLFLIRTPIAVTFHVPVDAVRSSWEWLPTCWQWWESGCSSPASLPLSNRPCSVYSSCWYPLFSVRIRDSAREHADMAPVR